METPKRKAMSSSSFSELDSSKNNQSTPIQKKKISSKEKRKQKKRRKAYVHAAIGEEKADLRSELESQNDDTSDDESGDDNMPLSVQKQLSEINKKLNNVITKADSSLLKSLIKETLLDMKEMMIEPLVHRVEILEGEIHEMSVENKRLKSEMDKLNKKIEKKSEDQHNIEKKIEMEEMKRMETANDQEQYSRRNNIRIISLPGDKPKETAEDTMGRILELFKKKLNIELLPRDIDIAHRIGKYSEGKNRQVIVKLVNRNTKHNIMASKKMLKGTPVSIFEDLTRMNSEVLASARKKMTNEVDQSWSREGKLYVKWRANGKIEKIEFKDYRHWLEMPWP